MFSRDRDPHHYFCFLNVDFHCLFFFSQPKKKKRIQNVDVLSLRVTGKVKGLHPTDGTISENITISHASFSTGSISNQC